MLLRHVTEKCARVGAQGIPDINTVPGRQDPVLVRHGRRNESAGSRRPRVYFWTEHVTSRHLHEAMHGYRAHIFRLHDQTVLDKLTDRANTVPFMHLTEQQLHRDRVRSIESEDVEHLPGRLAEVVDGEPPSRGDRVGIVSRATLAMQLGTAIPIQPMVGSQIDRVLVGETRSLDQGQRQTTQLLRQRLGRRRVDVAGPDGEQLNRRGGGERLNRCRLRRYVGSAGDQHITVTSRQQIVRHRGIRHIVQHQKPGLALLGKVGECRHPGVWHPCRLARRQQNLQQWPELRVDGRWILGPHPPQHAVVVTVSLGICHGETGLSHPTHPGEHLDVGGPECGAQGIEFGCAPDDRGEAGYVRGDHPPDTKGPDCSMVIEPPVITIETPLSARTSPPIATPWSPAETCNLATADSRSAANLVSCSAASSKARRTRVRVRALASPLVAASASSCFKAESPASLAITTSCSLSRPASSASSVMPSTRFQARPALRANQAITKPTATSSPGTMCLLSVTGPDLVATSPMAGVVEPSNRVPAGTTQVGPR